MKKMYQGLLAILTLVLLALITFNSLNNITGWVNVSKYENILDKICTLGPIVLMSLFAFGGLFGKVLSKVLFAVIVILLIILAVTIFAPNVIENIF